MNCRDAETLLDGFFDGELDDEKMREAAVHVARCGSCDAAIAERERVQGALRATVADDIEGLDLERIWRGVEAAMAEDARVGSQPAVWWRPARAAGRVPGRRPAHAPGLAREASRLDPEGEWLHRTRGGGRAMAWSVGAAGALAAGLLAFLVARGKARVEVAVDRAVPATTTVATAPVAAPAPVDQFAAAPTLPTRNSGRIAVDSVDFEGHSLAMWSEPETDTTVIWIDEDEPSVTGVR
jgi:anti-sigma factor RsiW